MDDPARLERLEAAVRALTRRNHALETAIAALRDEAAGPRPSTTRARAAVPASEHPVDRRRPAPDRRPE